MGKKLDTTIKVVKTATKVAGTIAAIGGAVVAAVSGDKK